MLCSATAAKSVSISEVYEILFMVGAIGFALMAVLGYVHGHAGSHGGPSHVAGHGHAAAAHGHAGGHAGTAHGAHGTGSHGSHSNSGSHGQEGGFTASWVKSAFLLAISPLDIFSLAMGAGLIGSIFTRIVSSTDTIIAAIIGAIIFDFALVKPLMKVIFKFAADPSEGLEGMVSQNAVAETAFDSSGKGLIKLCLDGQTVQLLARLDKSEIESGVRVAKGDSVTILEVDATRNTCRVTRDLNM